MRLFHFHRWKKIEGMYTGIWRKGNMPKDYCFAFEGTLEVCDCFARRLNVAGLNPVEIGELFDETVKS